eukprot:1142902-Pelagomonas_calceolata.AAC.1
MSSASHVLLGPIQPGRVVTNSPFQSQGRHQPLLGEKRLTLNDAGKASAFVREGISPVGWNPLTLNLILFTSCMHYCSLWCITGLDIPLFDASLPRTITGSCLLDASLPHVASRSKVTWQEVQSKPSLSVMRSVHPNFTDPSDFTGQGCADCVGMQRGWLHFQMGCSSRIHLLPPCLPHPLPSNHHPTILTRHHCCPPRCSLPDAASVVFLTVAAAAAAAASMEQALPLHAQAYPADAAWCFGARFEEQFAKKEQLWRGL